MVHNGWMVGMDRMTYEIRHLCNHGHHSELKVYFICSSRSFSSCSNHKCLFSHLSVLIVTYLPVTASLVLSEMLLFPSLLLGTLYQHSRQTPNHHWLAHSFLDHHHYRLTCTTLIQRIYYDRWLGSWLITKDFIERIKYACYFWSAASFIAFEINLHGLLSHLWCGAKL